MLSQFFMMAVLAAVGTDSAATFEAPVQLMAGDQTMGRKRLYPSPAMFDLDGDKKPEMIIGDLIGNLTVSRRAGKTWGEPEPLRSKDGEPLRFHNW